MMPAMSERPNAEPLIEALRVLSVAALLGLIALGLAWELWLAPTGNRTLALKVVPLALALAGLLKHRMYTYRWLSLLVWVYFTEGVLRAYGASGTEAALALTEVALSLLLFTACVAHVRRRLQRAAVRP
jgi:uncharacterized membrane protein